MRSISGFGRLGPVGDHLAAQREVTDPDLPVRVLESGGSGAISSHLRQADPLQRSDQMRKASRPGKYVWRFAAYASTVCRGGNKTDYDMLDGGFAVQFIPEFARGCPKRGGAPWQRSSAC
jgi:hypothetical protein